MSIEDVKTPEDRQKQKYTHLSSFERILKKSKDDHKQVTKAIKYIEEMNNEDIRLTFNCPGFKGTGYSATPLYDKGEYLEKYYTPYKDYKGQIIVRFQVLNRKRLAVHSVPITWTNKPYYNIDQANKLIIYTFNKGKGQDGVNFYIRERPGAKRIYAGSVLYNDETLINSVKYAIRELYLYGLTVPSVAGIVKQLTRYKGESNIQLNVSPRRIY